MKKLILITILTAFTLLTYSQSGTIKKPVTFSDTTLNKCFFTYDYSYTASTQIIGINLYYYMSKGSLRSGSNQLSFPETPRYFELDMTADQGKTLTQLKVVVKNAIKAKLLEINPTWTSSDVNFD